jgi:hypothetical protein
VFFADALRRREYVTICAAGDCVPTNRVASRRSIEPLRGTEIDRDWQCGDYITLGTTPCVGHHITMCAALSVFRPNVRNHAATAQITILCFEHWAVNIEGGRMPDGKRKRRHSLNAAKRRWYAIHRSRRFRRRFGFGDHHSSTIKVNTAITV